MATGAAPKRFIDRAWALTASVSRLRGGALVTNAPPRNRETEAVKAHARSAKRFGAAPVAMMAGHNHD